jgi:sugar transferase (PEP-CTERM/EpsH1 system associated)
MQILYLAQRVPYPPDRGDKIATYHHIRHLARNHEVAVACLADGVEDMARVAGLSPLATSVDAVPLSARRARLRALAAVARKKPLTLAYFDEPELHERVRKRVSSHRFDAIVVYSSSMAQFVEDEAGIPRVMAFSDLDSLKWAQYATSTLPPLSWVYGVEAHRLLRYEQHVAATFNHSLVCSARELKECQKLMPGARVSCVSNGVDLDYFQPRPVARAANALIFTGVMDYLPNIDGVTWFCRKVLPVLQKQVPDVTFTICGARPTRKVRQLARLPGVVVTGRVPDVRRYLASASVCVVPLRIARGIQNKLLEAMAMGLPAVATTAAFDGIEATDGVDLLVADEPREFASQILRLLKDKALRNRIGASARAVMERKYSWEARLAGLERILVHVAARPSQALAPAS